MDLPISDWFADAMAALVNNRELSPAQLRAAIIPILNGDQREVETAAFLAALRTRGETATELATAAQVMRERMIRWDAGPVLDTCGTGGDGLRTFNISTATALVVAGAGVAVVKHGNRAASSASGSADVLAELGVVPETGPEAAKRVLVDCGLAFCFAPSFHPALRHLVALRRRLAMPTLFNWLGPLANPAGATYQLLGVGRFELLDLMAGALKLLGTKRALVVCGHDGLDEVSLSAPTEVRSVAGQRVECWAWAPADFGLGTVKLEDLAVDGPAASAAVIREILDGTDGPAKRVVLANAAAAFLAAERTTTLAEGVKLADESIRSGQARKVLDSLIHHSRAEVP